MSQGAVFRLVLRDERFDAFYTASDYLRSRMSDIRAKRHKMGYKNVQPTFRDISDSHCFFLNEVYKPFVANACEYTKVKSSGDGTIEISDSGGSAAFTLPTYGHFTSDMVFNIKISPIGDPNGTTQYRYCALPGARMLRTVKWDSGEFTIDDYVPEDVIFYGNYHLQTDNRDGWLRAHGQQVRKTAEYQVNGITGCFEFKDGPQTLKPYHPEIEMWVPLQFYNCQAPQNAILNDFIANTQRKILVDLEKIDKIVAAYDDQGVQIPLPFNKLRMQIDLYVNNIFVNPEIYDTMASRIGFSLFRTHRRQFKSITNPEDRLAVPSLKFPAEYFHVGFRDKNNANDFDHWPLFGTNTYPSVASSGAILVPAMKFNPNPQPPVVNVGVCELVCRTGKISSESSLTPIIDELGVTAHGITIYQMVAGQFYSDYIPNRYAIRTPIVSPHDVSTYFVPFCLLPGTPAPSGYYNLSSGRDLRIGYKSSFISTSNPSEMVVTMSALNFLVRKGDKLSLRYAV